LLLKHTDNEYKYLAYLLYDLLSTDTTSSVDSNEQRIIYDSFPWAVKKFFKDAMKSTIQYTNELSNFDCNKIPLEQQICLMKASDSVKEKAMAKLKEVKTKSDELGIKAKQYLEGLIKIPFGIYKEEPILRQMKEINQMFSNLDELSCNYFKMNNSTSLFNLDSISGSLLTNEFINTTFFMSSLQTDESVNYINDDDFKLKFTIIYTTKTYNILNNPIYKLQPLE
jgi:Asp-tRNA(Asn)/Glu-tRNA(Gln) amidotransferase C subunit